jgi:hypothetical protein
MPSPSSLPRARVRAGTALLPNGERGKDEKRGTESQKPFSILFEIPGSLKNNAEIGHFTLCVACPRTLWAIYKRFMGFYEF